MGEISSAAENNIRFVYDICIIELVKSISSKALEDFLSAGTPDCYLCMGHFDMMQTQRLSGVASPLVEIQNSIPKERESETAVTAENCRYPLYALKQIPDCDTDTKRELDAFWATASNFLLVSRFHCDKTEDVTCSFSEALLDRSRQQLSSIVRSKLKIDPATRSYTRYLESTESPGTSQSQQVPVAAVAFYDSLELGDIVGIVKSNSISVAMEILQHLCGCKAVSDAYTYCGIESGLLQSNSVLPERREAALQRHTLSHTSTRFSIRLASKANVLLQNLKREGNIGFVTGTADVMVEWHVCSERKFLERIGRIVRFDELYLAFSDIITRIWIPYIPPEQSRSGPLQKAPFSEKLAHSAKLSEIFTGHLERWRYPVSRMVGTLQAMYESSILDTLALLLLPGVDAFLARVAYKQENNIWDSYDSEDISNFLDGWTALANDISHLESQIVQHPELTPARYYIPAMVLQFERTLLVEYVGLIKKLDELAQDPGDFPCARDFAPILLPTAEESVYTLCPLDPKFDPKYAGASPLCIFLPIQRIYQSWDLAHMLCHEIQHYSGDALRCREARLTCLSRSAAAYIISLLTLQLLQPDYYQHSNLSKERAFQEELAALISFRLRNQDATPYLSSIWENLPAIMFDIVQRSEYQERMQDILFCGSTVSDQMDNLHCTCQFNTLANGFVINEVFCNHVYFLCGLCKECYADIAMILTLDCSFVDYYRCIYGEEQRKFYGKPGEKRDQQTAERHTDRLALVILAVKACKSDWQVQVMSEDHWAVAAHEKVRHWEKVQGAPNAEEYTWLRYYSGDTIQEFSLLADEARELVSYLTQCAEKLSAALMQEQDAANSLRAHLGYVHSDCFDWEQARAYIE